jgi:hypothetical protein
MTTRDAIKTALSGTKRVLEWYLSDLSDADLLVRPVPNANHIAWQLGHLINSETRFFATVPGVAAPQLPAGFAEQHSKATASSDTGFRTKSEYLSLFNNVREATLAAVAKMSDADFDRPVTGDIAKFAPTAGALLLLQANHTVMHAGQFTVVRRKLGKPVLF